MSNSITSRSCTLKLGNRDHPRVHLPLYTLAATSYHESTTSIRKLRAEEVIPSGLGGYSSKVTTAGEDPTMKAEVALASGVVMATGVSDGVKAAAAVEMVRSLLLRARDI